MKEWRHDDGNQKMRYADERITSIGEFVDSLRSKAEREALVWYRGQRRADWKLLPNIARKTDDHPNGAMHQEVAAIKRFKQNAGAFLGQLPSDKWELMFLMQHHRGLTRLLDWSESPLVGLYFALEKGDDCEDGVVWCLDPMRLNEHSGHRRRNPRDVLGFGDDNVLDSYLPEMIGQEREIVMKPVAGIGPRNSARMVAQAGTFTIIHAEAEAVEDVADGDSVWRLIIPAAKKAELRGDLRLMGFNEFMLFPDLERVSLHTKELLE